VKTKNQINLSTMHKTFKKIIRNIYKVILVILFVETCYKLVGSISRYNTDAIQLATCIVLTRWKLESWLKPGFEL